jgi:hypothetical protein
MSILQMLRGGCGTFEIFQGVLRGCSGERCWMNGRSGDGVTFLLSVRCMGVVGGGGCAEAQK